MGYNSELLKNIIGQTLVKIDGMEVGSDSVLFTTADGNTLRLYHSSDCCESVDLNEIVGDVEDLIGSPLVMCEEVEDGLPEGPPADMDYEPESFTWTFYKFATVKGYVTLRWFGQSNGCYSESVTALYNDKDDGGRVPYDFR